MIYNISRSYNMYSVYIYFFNIRIEVYFDFPKNFQSRDISNFADFPCYCYFSILTVSKEFIIDQTIGAILGLA